MLSREMMRGGSGSINIFGMTFTSSLAHRWNRRITFHLYAPSQMM